MSWAGNPDPWKVSPRKRFGKEVMAMGVQCADGSSRPRTETSQLC